MTTRGDAEWTGWLSSAIADALSALGSGDPARARLTLRNALDAFVNEGGATAELEGILVELAGDELQRRADEINAANIVEDRAVEGHELRGLDPPHSAAGGSVRHDSPLNAA